VLSGDHCPEIEIIAQLLPRIREFENYIHKKRFKHKVCHEMQKSEKLV